MRVFVTGAAGFIGQAVVKDLIKHGHQVLGLVRKDAQAEIVRQMGAEPHTGSLDDLESLKQGAKVSDGIIHLAFYFDVANFAASIPQGCAMDRAAIEAMASVLGAGKPFVITTGTLLCKKHQLATEDGEVDSDLMPLAERLQSEQLLISLSKDKGIRGSVMRLSPTVHDVGDKGFMSMIAGSLKQAGAAIYPNNGLNKWNAVHRRDAASCFRLALVNGKAGAIYHAIGEEEVTMKDIVSFLGTRFNLPVKSLPLPEAMEAIGPFAHIMSMDNPASSKKTQEELGWKPIEVTLLQDMAANYVF